ncbi:hypothetical protein C8Q79DRAFT_448475 [Trametes meyenii]|nr:hypothetical protein C8Q79DRAFT_448475 [Trametes meyenii]
MFCANWMVGWLLRIQMCGMQLIPRRPAVGDSSYAHPLQISTAVSRPPWCFPPTPASLLPQSVVPSQMDTPSERVVLPSIRTLFPDLWNSPPPTRCHHPAPLVWPQCALKPSKVDTCPAAPPSRRSPYNADTCKSTPRPLPILHSGPPMYGDPDGGVPSVPAHSLAPLPLAVEEMSIRLTPPASDQRSDYSLGIMRLHPLTAHLEHVASSSNVSAPPRAPFRFGFVPSQAHEGTDASNADPRVGDGILNASTQPAFRVIMKYVTDTSPDAPGEQKGDPSRRHRCPLCGKGFNRPSSLVTHINMHTGAKPYACLFDGCPRRFNVKSNMRRHFQRHLRPRARRPDSDAPSTVSNGSSASELSNHESRSPSPESRRAGLISSGIDMQA